MKASRNKYLNKTEQNELERKFYKRSAYLYGFCVLVWLVCTGVSYFYGKNLQMAVVDLLLALVFAFLCFRKYRAYKKLL